MKYKYETLQEQGRENNNKILYILCQVVTEREREREDNILLHKDKDLNTSRLFHKSAPDDKHTNTQSNMNTNNCGKIKYILRQNKNYYRLKFRNIQTKQNETLKCKSEFSRERERMTD